MSVRFYIISLIVAVSAVVSAAPSGFAVKVAMDRLTFHSDEPVNVKIIITNRSGSPESFYIYDEIGRKVSYTTFQPVVVDAMGRDVSLLIPHTLEHVTREEVVKNCTKRSVLLMPGESFSYIVDLKKVYKLEEGESYRIKGHFFPDFIFSQRVLSYNSSQFTLERKKHFVYKSGVINSFRPKEYSREIQPSEIVALALRAEMDQDWKRLRKYIDVDKLIHSYTKFTKEFSQADVVERYRIRSRFVRYLARKRFDYLMTFSILGENITDNSAEVRVYVKRYGARKPFQYLYTYRLIRNRNDQQLDQWVITNLDASITKGLPQ